MTVALITGATKNIGLAIARRLGRDGYTIAVNGRSHAAVEAAVASLRADEIAASGFVADVSDESQVLGMAADVDRAMGPIDALVNNAGLRYHGPLASTPVDDWQRVIGVVLTGTFMTMRAVLPTMVERRWGRVINMAGLSAESGATHRAPLVAAKGGVIGLTRGAALEVADSGVTVNAISPGFIDTDRSPTLGDASVAEAHYRVGRDVPVGRVGQPDDVASMCAYLCSEGAAYVTGQVLRVNGGAYL